ncbi:L-lactate dehydrogenase [Shewanella gaetbuli]|uniref:L-lactate dehydrogenase n=1 Tax=Shewanella gaetbuli TaxID=220752 RepID=A0A9X1ZKL4_9GAMM|nr:L-lactate dehydrogenase [Shewanella gaetbuli]MCL1142707.1 L-lactate dehydrogenase [Shewanella gaetbuli]
MNLFMKPLFSEPATASDYRYLAKQKLPRFLFDYIDGGANAELTLERNCSDFNSLQLRQKVMRDVSHVDVATTLLGHDCALPLALAPVGMSGMMRQRGEVQAAKAASQVGVPFTLSTMGVCPVEEVNQAASRPCWFQLYMLKDRDAVLSILSRVKKAGCDTLVFTVDLAMPGLRHRDTRNSLSSTTARGKMSRAWQIAQRPSWVMDVGVKGKPHILGNLSEILQNTSDFSDYAKFAAAQFDPSVTWDDLVWLRQQWSGKLIIKGVLDIDDAKRSVDIGADAIVVSNHGARQLDSAPSSISVLPSIAKAINGDVEILMDGGVRNGVDLVKALILGANGAMIGRPWIWAVAAKGEQGLVDYLSLFKQEVQYTMALLGVNQLAELSPDLLYQ